MNFTITKRGVDITFASAMTDQQAAEICTRSGSEFATSLAQQFFANRRPLSDKQRGWLHFLAQPADTVATAAKAAPKAVCTLARIRRMIDLAVERGIKRPVLRCVSAKLGLRRNGNVYVVDVQSNNIVADIDKDGGLLARPNADILAELILMDQDPVEFASLYGHRTGACCFCGRHLETAESVTVGYGPICAGHYGLPWGRKDSAVSTSDIVKKVANG